MKSFILMSVALMFSITSMYAGDKKVLVAYFSCTGNTERVAVAMAKASKWDVCKIEPMQKYTSADLDWRNKKSRSSVEMADEKARPALAKLSVNPKDYDVIFVGYPIWWNLCPRIINTFLERNNLNGKTVVPFATSGGNTIANSEKALRAEYPAINWSAGALLNGSESEAVKWSKSVIGRIQK